MRHAWCHDGAGKVTVQVLPDGSTTYFGYSACGRLSEKVTKKDADDTVLADLHSLVSDYRNWSMRPKKHVMRVAFLTGVLLILGLPYYDVRRMGWDGGRYLVDAEKVVMGAPWAWLRYTQVTLEGSPPPLETLTEFGGWNAGLGVDLLPDIHGCISSLSGRAGTRWTHLCWSFIGAWSG